MERLIQCIRRKSQLLYDINCIRQYIETGECDRYLRSEWDQYHKELEEVTKEIQQLKVPEIRELEKKKLDLLSAIQNTENELKKQNQQLTDLDNKILNLKK
jgi:peptidoglycan hydrolase CwlO-like protein